MTWCPSLKVIKRVNSRLLRAWNLQASPEQQIGQDLTSRSTLMSVRIGQLHQGPAAMDQKRCASNVKVFPTQTRPQYSAFRSDWRGTLQRIDGEPQQKTDGGPEQYEEEGQSSRMLRLISDIGRRMC